MRDMLRTGSAWLSDQMRHHASTLVYYRRGAASVQLAATIGRSEFDVTDEQGFSLRVESRDYIVNTAELELDGIPVEPAVGDRIIEGDLEDGFAYEVASVAGQPHWHYADQFKERIRIHTKYVGPFPPSP